MKVFVDPERSAATQMARDHELFERALRGESCARIYEWDQVWVTLGRFQAPNEVFVDPTFSSWTQRETGGGAVLHGHDLTVGVAIPLTAQTGVRDVYRQLVRPIVVALQECGVDAALGEDAGFAERAQGAYCFLGKSQNDIVSISSSKKLCGCALRVTRQAALLQASIPVRVPKAPAAEIILGASEDAWIEIEAVELKSSMHDQLHRVVSL